MTVSPLAILRDAFALFRRDRGWLLPLIAPFTFLPALALALLTPRMPAVATAAAGSEGDSLARAQVMGEWLAAYGGWHLLGYLLASFGTAALLAAYLDPEAPDVRRALRRAGPILPRLLIASALVAIPTGAGLYLWWLPGLYVMGRTVAVGPVVVAEGRAGAVAAVLRALRLSAGSGLPLTALAAALLLAGVALAQPFVALAPGPGENPVVAAVAAAGLAAVSTAVAVAQALCSVVAYRLLAAR